MLKTVSSSQLPVNENLIIQKQHYSNNSGSKRLSIVTGTHGDELEGQYVCFLLSEMINKNPQALNGIIDIYPALNPLGLDSITRGIPLFDLDMNRIFPGSQDGSMADVTASSIINDIQGSDICIDIHSSNIFLREIPQIRISVPTAPELLPYAKLLNIDFIWVHESATVLESTLAHSLNIRGTKTLVVEMGVGMRITSEYCHQLAHGIMHLLSSLNMWSLPVEPVKSPIISMDGEVDFINSPVSGIFIPTLKHGDCAAQGDQIGSILNPLTGQIDAILTASCNGMIFTLREYPIVYSGSLIARILKR